MFTQIEIIVTLDMQAALSADAIVDRIQETIGESNVSEQAIYDFDEFTMPLSVSHVQDFCVTDEFGWYLVVKTQKTGVLTVAFEDIRGGGDGRILKKQLYQLFIHRVINNWSLREFWGRPHIFTVKSMNNERGHR